MEAASDIKTTFLSPFHWDKKDLLIFSAVVVSGLILGFSDQGIRDRVLRHKTPGSDDFFNSVGNFGNGLYLCGFAAGLTAIGTVSKSDGLRSTAPLSFESFLVSGIITDVFKAIPGRARGRIRGRAATAFTRSRSCPAGIPSRPGTLRLSGLSPR
jgi:hypothetical protein